MGDLPVHEGFEWALILLGPDDEEIVFPTTMDVAALSELIEVQFDRTGEPVRVGITMDDVVLRVDDLACPLVDIGPL